jgi:sporulation protein YlmC with PRC-barrel domain
MLRSLKELERYKVNATDGHIGSVVDFLLDDQRWTVRYLVVETGSFFSERRVLITPISFRQVDWSTKQFHLALTMDKVKSSPNVDVDMPVSRQHERDYYGYYGYPYYWADAGLWGMSAYPGALATSRWYDASVENAENASDIHLRSVNEVRGYTIQGSDEEIGHVDDFIVDDESWEVCYLVVDTSNWWFGRKVLIAPRWATRVSWEERIVHVNMNRQQITNSPEWSPTVAINREYETRLHKHYGRPAYWDDAARRVQAPAAE